MNSHTSGSSMQDVRIMFHISPEIIKQKLVLILDMYKMVCANIFHLLATLTIVNSLKM